MAVTVLLFCTDIWEQMSPPVVGSVGQLPGYLKMV